MPAPAPELVGADDKAPAVKQPTSKRAQQQQQASGTSALKIPLNTGKGSGAGSGQKSAGLNIPT